MPEFQTITQAFEWFLENIYPDLPTERKTPLREAKHTFYNKDRNMSTKRMKRILDEHSDYEQLHKIGKMK